MIFKFFRNLFKIEPPVDLSSLGTIKIREYQFIEPKSLSKFKLDVEVCHECGQRQLICVPKEKAENT